MYRDKDFRLQQQCKYKNRARRYLSWAWHRDADERLIGMRYRTRKQCSCWGCSNQQRMENKRREIAAVEEMWEELQDVCKSLGLAT